MISATELVQIAAPARSAGFVAFSGSLGSAKVFRAEPHEARYGRVKGRAQASFSWPHRVPDRHYHRGTLEASQSNFHLACGDRRAAASSRTSAAISA